MTRGRKRAITQRPEPIEQEILEDRFDEKHRRKWTKRLRQPDAPTPATIVKSWIFTNKVKSQIERLVKGNITSPLTKWTSWKKKDKENLFVKFLCYFSFEDIQMARECFDNYIQLNYTCWLYKARQEAKKLANVDKLTRSCARFPPIYLSAEVWSDMVDSWLKEDCQKRSEKATENRKTNPDYMSYTGGSCSITVFHQKMTDDNELQKNTMEAGGIDINDQAHSSNASHTLPNNLELWVKNTEEKKKGRVLETRASDPMSLPSNPNMATSQNISLDIFEIQRQTNKEAFDLAVQEVIRKQMPDIVKEVRESLRRETVEGQSSQGVNNIVMLITRYSNIENVNNSTTDTNK